MKIIEINESNFNESVKNGKVLVDFYATWCGPCKMLAPVLEEIANAHDDVKIFKVNVDENNGLSRNFGVMSVPTLLLFEDEKLIARHSGFMMKNDLEKWIFEKK